MIAALAFDYPHAWLFGLPLAAAVLGLWVGLQWSSTIGRPKLLVLMGLRAAVVLALIFLAARPVWVAPEPPPTASRPVVVLFDRSESMSLEEGGETRWAQALRFAQRQLFPALKSAGLNVSPLSFAQDAEPTDDAKLTAAKPDGKRTNLGGAIARALGTMPTPPLAAIVLTDGAVNERAENSRALTALVEGRVPFIGVGFGSDVGPRTLSLRQLDAPSVVAPGTAFNVTAQLEISGGEEMPLFDLVLFREGRIMEKRTISAGKDSRQKLEHFRVTESGEGIRNYSVQLMPPAAPGLKVVSNVASAAVRISAEKELRVLYVQGALTWDYKFAALALRGDQSIKLTGLTRTSKQSVFRQNIESAGELTQGFPNTMEELGEFRVVVLSNLRPTELTPAQQELLARFCGELGGGLLLIGGPDTFDGSWRGSRLEQLLPVVFALGQGATSVERPFRVQLTDEALQSPVFQIADNRPVREIWATLPSFTQYGRIDAAKPGAHVWAEHDQDAGPHGRRILMASQRYGAGLTVVIALQNFWRWRLAKDVEPQQFDRFWRQLFRYLGEIGRQDVTIHVANQELHPQMDVRLVLEKQPNPKSINDRSGRFFVRVENERKQVLIEQGADLTPGRPVDVAFRAETAGIYQVRVVDANKEPVALRTVEIREVNLEFQNSARDMETLRQWALLTDGLAVKAEECQAGELIARIVNRAAEIQKRQPMRVPVGVNGWMLIGVLLGLTGDWVLRKKWGLT